MVSTQCTQTCSIEVYYLNIRCTKTLKLGSFPPPVHSASVVPRQGRCASPGRHGAAEWSGGQVDESARDGYMAMGHF